MPTHAEAWVDLASNAQVRKWIKAAGVPASLEASGWTQMADEHKEKLRKVMNLEQFERHDSLFTANFAAWQTMDQAKRVKCIEDVGYPTGFAKQWAGRDFTSLPADIKAGLLANGYFKNFVAENSPVTFGGPGSGPQGSGAGNSGAGNSGGATWDQLDGNQRAIFVRSLTSSKPPKPVEQMSHEELTNWISKSPQLLQTMNQRLSQLTAGDAVKFAAQFSAESFWRGMDEESRVDFLEAVLSLPRLNARAFARQYWNSLPKEIKADIEAGYNNAHGYSANFAAFQDLTKLASDLLKSGAAESDVRNALKAQGCTDENQQREVLAAARSYESRETFAAQEPMRPGQRVADDWERSGVIVATRLDGSKRMVEVRWDGRSSTEWVAEDLLWRKGGGKETAFNSDTMKPGGKFSAKFAGGENDTAVWWNGKSESERVAKLKKLFPDEDNEDHAEVARGNWPSLPLPVRRALMELHTRSTYASSQPLNGPGLKQDVVNQVLTNPERFAAYNDKPPFGKGQHRYVVKVGKENKVVLTTDDRKQAVDKARELDAGQGAAVWDEEDGKFIFSAVEQTAKFTASLPTDDPAKPEVKEFGSATEAVNYLADNGYINDRSRAVARLDATGKWSAPSGASVVRAKE